MLSWGTKNWCLQTVVLEKTLESPLDCKKIKPVNPKGKQHWIFTGRTDAGQYFGHLMWGAISLGKAGERDDRGWDGWMTLLTEWTWVWANSGRYWKMGNPGVLQYMGSQRVTHDWLTEHTHTRDLFFNDSKTLLPLKIMMHQEKSEVSQYFSVFLWQAEPLKHYVFMNMYIY